MAIDTLTVTLLTTVLGSPGIRKLFTSIAKSRIAELTSLKKDNPDADEVLTVLQGADLIGADRLGEKFYVTARGLKVARDLGNL